MAVASSSSNLGRKILVFALVAFAFEFGMPHISVYAQEQAERLARAEEAAAEPITPPFELMANADDLLGRAEKLWPAYMVGQSTAGLPLEGEPSVVSERWVTVSAYSSTRDQTDGSPFTTAWGTPVRDGIVALNFLPKGTMVRFPDYFGDKLFIVEDRMNVRYPHRADVWMPTREQARQFGLRYLRLEVLGVQVDREYVLAHFEPAFPNKK